MFIHLHGHSHYSLLEGLGSISKIVDKAKALEMEAIAITDYNAMYGAVEFFKLAKKAGIKGIIGVELGIVQNIQKKDIKENIYNIVLLAQNLDGYQNLMELVSMANIKGFSTKPTIDFELLKKYSNGLIGFMGSEKSLIGQMILNNESAQKISEIILIYKELLGENNFFLEITAQDYQKNNNIKIINDNLINLSNQTNTKLIINSNFHYINKDDKDAYEVLLCIKEGKYMHDATRPRINNDLHIFSKQEIIDIMLKNGFKEEFILGLIQNNQDLSNSIDLKIPLGQILFPKYESPKYIEEIYEKYKDSLIE